MHRCRRRRRDARGREAMADHFHGGRFRDLKKLGDWRFGSAWMFSAS